MIDWVKRVFKKKGGNQITEDGFIRIMSSEQVSLIREEWSNYSVNLDIQFCNSFDHIDSFPRRGEKNDFIIGIIPWEKRNVDVIIYTKHTLSGEHVLNTTFENLTKEQIRELGLLPINNRTVCSYCNEFSTQINIDLKCQDCS